MAKTLEKRYMPMEKRESEKKIGSFGF